MGGRWRRGSSLTDWLAGRPVAERVLERALREVETGRGRGVNPPGLVSVHTASTSPFSFYLKQQARTAESVQVRFRAEKLPLETTTASLAQRLAELDADPSTDAVLVEHPLPAPIDLFAALERLRPEKDVDGLSAASLGRLVQGRPIHQPAVSRAVMETLRQYDIDLEGRRVAIVGRSATVGLPTALLLAARRSGGDATVTIAHSKSAGLTRVLKDAEVIVSAAGKPGLLDRTNVPEGAVVVDVGLSSIPDPNQAGGVRAVGDVDAASIDGWARAATPVPGGIGPVTVAMLLENVVLGWKALHREALG